MRDLTGIYCARESLMTHATALNVVADNLANVNTTGFKAERVEFGDIIAESMGCLMGDTLSSGNGVMAEDITAGHSKQGSLEFTDRSLDTAIEGNGYFILTDGTDRFYTRAGNFVTDTEGNLTSVSGENVMGYTAASPTELVALNVAGTTGTATATTKVTMEGNLDAETIAGAAPGVYNTYAALNEADDFSTSIRVVDSLGANHDVGLHFFKTGNGAWTVRAYVSETDVTEGAEDIPTQIGDAQITFGPDGNQTSATSLSLATNWANGATGTSATVDLSNMTGFAASSAITGTSGDGNSSGNLQSVSIEDDGTVVSVLDNGEQITIGQLALAMFAAPTELQRVGDNNYQETGTSGTAQAGLSGVDGRGKLQGGALETSTVDPANEFISMVRYQRGYQASSKALNTISEIIGQTIQLA